MYRNSKALLNIYWKKGDINASEIAAQQGIQIHPNAVALHLKYAQVLLSKGKFEDAIKHLNFVERVETNKSRCPFNKRFGMVNYWRRNQSCWLVSESHKNCRK